MACPPRFADFLGDSLRYTRAAVGSSDRAKSHIFNNDDRALTGQV